MSDRMTECRVKKRPLLPAYAIWGRHSRKRAIAEYRAFYQTQRAQAEAALGIPDDELEVVTYIGPHARRNVEVVP